MKFEPKNAMTPNQNLPGSRIAHPNFIHRTAQVLTSISMYRTCPETNKQANNLHFSLIILLCPKLFFLSRTRYTPSSHLPQAHPLCQISILILYKKQNMHNFIKFRDITIQNSSVERPFYFLYYTKIFQDELRRLGTSHCYASFVS